MVLLAATAPVVSVAAVLPAAVLPAGVMGAAAGGLAVVFAGGLVLAAERTGWSCHFTASKGRATFFSPIPRKPPTPTMTASILPLASTRISLTSPMFSVLLL